MPTLQASGIADLVAMTQVNYGKLKFTDLMSNYQNTIALKRFMKKGKMSFRSGRAVDFNVITDTNHSAKMVGLDEIDDVSTPNVMIVGEVPWRHTTWNYAHDKRVLAMNREPARIVDLLQTQRIASFGSAVILFEIQLWQAPAITNTVDAFGLPAWIVKSNTSATVANNNGFNGNVPSGWTTVGGINPTTYPRWANYATQYTSPTKDDFVRKARRLRHYVEFMPLVDEIPQYEVGNDYGQYTNYALCATLEELLEAQNDDLGSDVASMEGKTLLARVPVTPVRQLDADTTNPMYFVDWSVLHAMGLEDLWMYETVIPVVPGQHNKTQTHTDCTWNTICHNRRKQGVLATDTTMPSAVAA